jgi:hypothetical protein
VSLLLSKEHDNPGNRTVFGGLFVWSASSNPNRGTYVCVQFMVFPHLWTITPVRIEFIKYLRLQAKANGRVT